MRKGSVLICEVVGRVSVLVEDLLGEVYGAL